MEVAVINGGGVSDQIFLNLSDNLVGVEGVTDLEVGDLSLAVIERTTGDLVEIGHLFK